MKSVLSRVPRATNPLEVVGAMYTKTGPLCEDLRKRGCVSADRERQEALAKTYAMISSFLLSVCRIIQPQP